jgi:adenosylmethionine-8-amino-7-oxononanoate aminotransferase
MLRPLGDDISLMPPLSTTEEELRCLVAAASESIAVVTGE